jgi:Mycothiol maleylpyruvate isomerase N-terminal domain
MTEVAARASFDKASVLRRIHRTWGSLDDFCRELSDEQMSSGGPDGWTVKDHVAHIAAWQLSLAALLERRDRQAALGLKAFSTTDWDGQNEVMLRRHRPLVPTEARALELGSRAMVLGALESLSDDDLGRPYSDFQPQDLRTSFPTSQDCLVHWIMGSIEDHVGEHLLSMRPLV